MSSRSAAGRRRLDPAKVQSSKNGKKKAPAELPPAPPAPPPIVYQRPRAGSLDLPTGFVFPSPSRSNGRPPPSSHSNLRPPLSSPQSSSSSASVSGGSSTSPTSSTFSPAREFPNRPASLHGAPDSSQFVFPSPSRSYSRPETSPKIKSKSKKKKRRLLLAEHAGSAPEVVTMLGRPESELAHHRSFMSFGLKKKKKKASSFELESMSSGERYSVADITTAMVLITPEGDTFKEKDTWIKRYDMRLHPYPLDAPYMQAYNPILLDNDRHTDALLRRLYPQGSPTFYDYGSKPPLTVLDLGCGQGHWVLDAATIWKSYGTKVTGFDLVDVTKDVWSWEDDQEVTKNIKLVRGNFVKYKLPFPDRSFELVRMANLTLCIPYEKWQFVLSEAYRVLTVGGRLEIIDDQLVFPYGQAPSSTRASPPLPPPQLNIPIPSPSFRIEQDDDNSDLDALIEGYAEYDDHDSSSGSSQVETTSYGSSPTPQPRREHAFPFPMPPTNELTPWEYQVTASEELETVFETMLSQKFGIHPRPADFLLAMTRKVFGRDNAAQMKSLHLKLAPPIPHPHPAPVPSQKNLYQVPAGAESGFISPWRPDSVGSEGNFWRLTYTGSPGPSSPQRSSNHLSQSPGLVLSPSTFIPISPSELEMHACKHMHVVLGCKAAIWEFVDGTDDSGARFVEEDEFREAMWDYECFLSQRFSWPSGKPGRSLDVLSAAIQSIRDTELDSVNFRESTISTSPMSDEYRDAISDYQSELASRFDFSLGDDESRTTVYDDNATPRSSTFRSAAGLNHAVHPRDSCVSLTTLEGIKSDRSDGLTHVRTFRVFCAVKTVSIPFRV